VIMRNTFLCLALLWFGKSLAIQNKTLHPHWGWKSKPGKKPAETSNTLGFRWSFCLILGCFSTQDMEVMCYSKTSPTVHVIACISVGAEIYVNFATSLWRTSLSVALF
jgi:hypothetical protein